MRRWTETAIEREGDRLVEIIRQSPAWKADRATRIALMDHLATVCSGEAEDQRMACRCAAPCSCRSES